MLHHSQSILLCSKHIAVWRCFKFTRTGSSNQTTVSLRSNSFKLQHHLEVLQLWCRFKPMGTARFVAEWEKPNSKWRKHAVQFTSQGPPLSQLAPMSNLGSCHKIPQGPSCQIETPELCVELYIFSPLCLKPGFYFYSIFQQQLQVNWTPFLTWQAPPIRISQTELVATGLSIFSSSASRNTALVQAQGNCCIRDWRMPFPLIIAAPRSAPHRLVLGSVLAKSAAGPYSGEMVDQVFRWSHVF